MRVLLSKTNGIMRNYISLLVMS